MTLREAEQLRDATADAIERRLGRQYGFVLLICELREGGEVWSRTNLEDLVAAGILDDAAEYYRAMGAQEI